MGVPVRDADVRGGNRMAQEANAGMPKGDGKRVVMLLLQAAARR